VTNKQVIYGILGVSAALIGLLFWIIYGVSVDSVQLRFYASQLPFFQVMMNVFATICIVAGIFAVKTGRLEEHKRLMASAFMFSVLFLLSYLVYHTILGDIIYGGVGWMRTVYFSLLISHIGATFFGFPMILITIYFAVSKQLSSHKKIARWTYPIWLYMSVTGVVVFFMVH